jgi:polygalacturonase
MRAPLLVLLAATSAAPYPRVSITDFGAVGDNATDNTGAVRAALAAVAGGGEVLVPAGVFKTGPFNLTSNVVLRVEGTAFALESVAAFPLVAGLPSYASSMPGPRHHPFVWTVNQTNVTVAGGGEINGAGPFWWVVNGTKSYSIARPHLMELHGCAGCEVTGVTLRNSAFWTLRPVYSRAVHIHDMRIEMPWCDTGGMNTDGIDVDSTVDVVIERNHIACGDDHVTVLAGAGASGRAMNLPSRNVTVRDNVLGTGMGLSVGSSVSGGVEDVLFINNTMAEGVGQWGMGAHLKTRVSYGGFVRNVAWVDNAFAYVSTNGIFIETDYQSSGNCTADTCTEIRDIVFRNFTVAQQGGEAAGVLSCFPARPCVNVTLDNVHVNASRWTCAHVASGAFTDVTPPGLAAACGLERADAAGT